MTHTSPQLPLSTQVDPPLANVPQEELGNEIAEGGNVQVQLQDVVVTEQERNYARAPSTVPTAQFNRQHIPRMSML